jgi:hypothetical protein
MPPARNLKGRRLLETREETESVIASLMERGVEPVAPLLRAESGPAYRIAKTRADIRQGFAH